MQEFSLLDLKLDIGERYDPSDGEILEIQTERIKWRAVWYVRRIEQAWLIFYRVSGKGSHYTKIPNTRDAVGACKLRRRA